MPTLITTAPEYATLDTVPLAAGSTVHNYAWLATSLADVRMPARLRGSDRLLPTASGIRVNPRRVTSSRRLVPMLFTGDCDSDGGAALTTPDEQVWLNFDEWMFLVMEPDPLVLTRTLTVTHGSLEWEGEVVIEDFEYGIRGPSEIVGVLDLSIPAGRLILEGGGS